MTIKCEVCGKEAPRRIQNAINRCADDINSPFSFRDIPLEQKSVKAEEFSWICDKCKE